MILYFSGTGNSEYIAKRISQGINDEALNLFDRIRNKDYSELCSEKPWVVVTPTYAWRVPRVVEELLDKTPLSGSKDIYFVMTCGDGNGNAAKYAKEFCQRKNLSYMGCMKVVMPENYIAMFVAPNKEEALEIIEKAEPVVDVAIECILNGKSFSLPKTGLLDKIYSGPVNKFFYKAFVKDEGFFVTGDCISCGRCAAVCPMKNIVLDDTKPVWGGNCTHCMACICRCPRSAIEYGKHTKGLVRYVCPKK